MAQDLRTTVEFLTSTEGRLEILETLQERPLSQEEIVGQSSASKKTVQRWLGDLIEKEWIKQQADQYKISTVGRTLLKGYKHIRDSVAQQLRVNELGEADEVDVRESVAFIAGSKNRPRTLKALRDQPVQQIELVRKLSVSRATIHRLIRNLENRGWIQETTNNRLHELTTQGEVLLGAYEDVSGMIKTIHESEPFLSALIDDQLVIPVEALEAGTVIVASPENPHTAVVNFLQNLRFDDTVRFRSMAPVVSDVYKVVSATRVKY